MRFLRRRRNSFSNISCYGRPAASKNGGGEFRVVNPANRSLHKLARGHRRSYLVGCALRLSIRRDERIGIGVLTAVLFVATFQA
jgi:hypothetical protein